MDNHTCTVRECGGRTVGRGYCRKHYNRWHKHGDPEVTKRRPQGMTLADAFEYFGYTESEAGCHNWNGYTSHSGYAAIRWDYTYLYTHRVAYELANGSIPEGLEVDHICHNKRCVNPAHLRAVTRKQNIENHNGAHANSKSGVRGVCRDSSTGKWRAQVKHNHVNYYLGLYDDLASAESVVVSTRNRLHTHNDRDRTAA